MNKKLRKQFEEELKQVSRHKWADFFVFLVSVGFISFNTWTEARRLFLGKTDGNKITASSRG